MTRQPPGGATTGVAPVPFSDEVDVDVLGLDLESLRTTTHPVLSALVDDLRERIAAPGGEALWSFDSSVPST